MSGRGGRAETACSDGSGRLMPSGGASEVPRAVRYHFAAAFLRFRQCGGPGGFPGRCKDLNAIDSSVMQKLRTGTPPGPAGEMRSELGRTGRQVTGKVLHPLLDTTDKALYPLGLPSFERG